MRWCLFVGAFLGAVGCTKQTWVEQEELALETYAFVDTDRVTPAVQEYPGSPERALSLWVWSGPYSGYGADRPLLFMAHGGGGHPEKFTPFATALAEAGIVVAAVVFPLTNQAAPVEIVYGISDVSNQPADVSASLDWLLEAVADREHALYGQFSEEQFAYLGHSLGGQTGLAASRMGCCLEERFQAWILAAPYLYLNDTLFPDHPLPAPASGPATLLLHGAEDTVAGIDQTETLYETFDGTKAFVSLTGATHSEYLEGAEEAAAAVRAQAQDLTVATLKDWVQGEEGALEAALKAAADKGHEAMSAF
jgi:pimeloyl-ACP methyl ester carboxylesterase